MKYALYDRDKMIGKREKVSRDGNLSLRLKVVTLKGLVWGNQELASTN